MSSNQRNQILEDLLSELEKHEGYRFVEIKSVISKLDDDKWHNYLTFFKMLQSGKTRPWKRHFEKNNFIILSAAITIDKFKVLIKRFFIEQVLDIDDYRIKGPFNFNRRYFYESNQAKRSYNIDYAVNIWRISEKENIGLPDSRSLELESNDIPFTDTMYAVGYYTGVSVSNTSDILNAIHIVAPLYYGRLKGVELANQELTVESDLGTSNTVAFVIKYNTMGRLGDSLYCETIEGGTIDSVSNITVISLKKRAESANVWLYHTKGFKVDYREARRKRNVEDLEETCTQENFVDNEGYLLITNAIESTVETEIANMLTTTELSVDSIDGEILKAIKTKGGEYNKFFPEVLKYISLKMLLQRLTRLRILGFLTVQPPKKILLTSLGVDALNFPPSILSANVPADVDRRLSEIKVALKEENYDEVTNKSTKLLEALLREKLEFKFEGTLKDVWPNLKLVSYDRAALGALKEACISLKIFERNDTSDHLISTILKLRVSMAHEKEEINYPSNIAFLTERLVEAFLRNWYYIAG
ncbi:MAG: hypothetical protein NWF05_07535 [Candidatus Bathyarchaeota archaeon]|nr:hypothetical protein [Candidatus Bathyarchaeota archaeon]